MSAKTCSFVGCDRTHLARGWCHAHYQQHLQGVSPMHPIGIRNKYRTCTVRGCDAPCNQRCCKDHTRFGTMLKKYGLTADEYYAMLDEQDGLCASCKLEPAAVMDHCHKTGKLGGILCQGCNLGLGHFKDDPKRLRMAAEYLEEHRGSRD